VSARGLWPMRGRTWDQLASVCKQGCRHGMEY
jgi:hypothetical protein